MSSFEPALCSVTFRKLKPEKIVGLSLDAGLAAIEWAGDAHVPLGDTMIATHVARLSRKAGFATSYGSYVAPPTADLAVFRRALETAIALDASNIRIWPGTRERASSDYNADERRSTVDAIRDMATEAARSGLTVALEYHPLSLTENTDSARRLIDAIAHSNVYLYWQPRPGLALDDALAEIAEIGAHVSHVHVFAWNSTRNRFSLKTASAYWRTVFSAMPASRWTGRRFAMLEFVVDDDPLALLDDAATLRQILKA